MTDQKISVEKRGHLVLIGANRAPKMNAYDVDMLRQLGDAYGALEADDDARCAVVFAHGDHFTAGLDLGNVAPAIMAGDLALGAGAIDPWGVHGRARTKPVVLAVHGRCLTLGIELILASDVCVAADNTKFGQIEVKRGIFPFGGATYRLVQRAGWGNAMRYLLTGDDFDAAEALRIGLIQEVAPLGTQLDRAIAIAERIAAQAPLAVRATIASARKSLAADEAAAIDGMMADTRALMQSSDAREGLASFLERRAAQFTGK
jgi:enoyl-CoA hydratase/carnithine racemase